MASIEKRGKSFRITVNNGFDAQGIQIRERATFTPEPGTEKQRKKAAEDFARDFEKQVKNGTYIDSSILFEVFAEKWMEDYAKTQLAPGTIYHYNLILNRINAAIGRIAIGRIQPHHLLEFYNTLAQPGTNNKIPNAGLSASTIVQYHRLISNILNAAVHWQALESNPALRVKPPKIQRHEVKCFDDVQSRDLIQMLDAAPKKYKTAIILFLFTGFRLGEVCGLKWSDIDFDSNTISVSRSVQYLPEKGVFVKSTKNKSSERVIKVDELVFDLLSEHKTWQIELYAKLGRVWHDNVQLFTSTEGGLISPKTISKWYRNFRISNSIYVKGTGVHALRHTNASLQIASGINIQTVAHRLGHATAQTTLSTYAHAINSADALAAEVIGNILAPIGSKETSHSEG